MFPCVCVERRFLFSVSVKRKNCCWFCALETISGTGKMVEKLSMNGSTTDVASGKQFNHFFTFLVLVHLLMVLV